MSIKKTLKSKTTTQTKKSSSTKTKKPILKRFLIFTLKAFAVAVLLVALLFIIVYLGFTGSVPDSAELHKIKNSVASEIISEDGQVIGRYYIENRSNVAFSEISPNLINALIATEDARFYEHRGIDEIALMRVLFKTILMMDLSSGGGSTLSQQIAKNLYPRQNLGPLSMPVAKLRESIIAYRLEKLYTKEEILTLYLNTVPFAENIFGVEVACERFFSKKTDQVNVSEAATIVGMLKANNSYNPRKNPERAKERRNTVINQMVKYNYITEAEGEKYKKEPLVIKYQIINYNQGPATYFVEMLRPFLLNWCKTHFKIDNTPYNLYTDGLKIRTTINSRLQKYAVQAMTEHMKNLQQVFDEHWKGRDPWGKDNKVVDRAIRRSDYYKQLKESGLNEAAIKTEFAKIANRTMFSWNGIEQKQVSAIDSVKHYLKMLNAGFMAVNPYNGEVRAYIGGIDFRFFQYDHVKSQRQVGSTFKPIIYLAALESGIPPNIYFANEQKIYENYNNWMPENSHDEYTGFYSMEGALAHSINTISVEVLMQTGFDKAIQVAHSLGISEDLPAYPSLALGVASLPLNEMVCAYSAFVNGGKRVKPYYLVSIESANGEDLEKYENIQDEEPVVEPENCRIITKMLKTTITEGTGTAIKNVYGIDTDFAGKTGTTQDQADGWFIGMTPDLVAGAWVGGEDPAIHFRSITYGRGGYMALPIVGKFFSSMLNDSRFANLKYNNFVPPTEENLAIMDIQTYRDMLEVDRRGFRFGNIFGKKKAEDRAERKDRQREQKPEKEEKKVWERIKDIFKKNK